MFSRSLYYNYQIYYVTRSVCRETTQRVYQKNTKTSTFFLKKSHEKVKNYNYNGICYTVTLFNRSQLW